MSTPCDRIAQTLPALFECSEVNDFVKIRTPFVYPDGDVIDLYVTQGVQGPTLTDFGETLRWLQSQSLSKKRTVKQKLLIDDICSRLGVCLRSGMLQVPIDENANFGDLVTRLAQASIKVSDLWFTFRWRVTESVMDEVATFLEDKELAFERDWPVAGHSGRVWKVDFHVTTPQQESFVNVLSTGSKAASKKLVEHVVALWWDIARLRGTPNGHHRFLSLFDDTVDVWGPEDISLVESLSDVAFWSRPDELYHRLVAVEA